MDLAVVSSMGNRTSTCLMYGSFHDKNNFFFINFAFKCRLVIETHTIVLMQASNQANLLASAIDHVTNTTNFSENCTSNSFFFLKTKRDMLFNFCIWHKKGVSGKHPIHENNKFVCFH